MQIKIVKDKFDSDFIEKRNKYLYLIQIKAKGYGKCKKYANFTIVPSPC